MLGVFKKELVSPPKELNSPASFNHTQHPLKHFLSSNANANAFSIAFGNDVSLAFDPTSHTSSSHQRKMLGVFKKELVSPPKELNSPASFNHTQHPLKHFLSSNANANAFSIAFGNDVSLAFDPTSHTSSSHQRLFCSMDDIYCIFLGGLNNLCTLNKQYGLNKLANEPMFVIQAYKTLRDRGPYPAHSVLQELDGSFGFMLYDLKAKTVFVSLGGDGGVKLFWGIGGDGCVVISDNLEVIKTSCSKSFAPFPTGCMYHTEGGLMSFEHPKKKMKAISRVDSEGVMCGATFKVDVY